MARTRVGRGAHFDEWAKRRAPRAPPSFPAPPFLRRSVQATVPLPRSSLSSKQPWDWNQRGEIPSAWQVDASAALPRGSAALSSTRAACGAPKQSSGARPRCIARGRTRGPGPSLREGTVALLRSSLGQAQSPAPRGQEGAFAPVRTCGELERRYRGGFHDLGTAPGRQRPPVAPICNHFT